MSDASEAARRRREIRQKKILENSGQVRTSNPPGLLLSENFLKCYVGYLCLVLSTIMFFNFRG